MDAAIFRDHRDVAVVVAKAGRVESEETAEGEEAATAAVPAAKVDADAAGDAGAEEGAE